MLWMEELWCLIVTDKGLANSVPVFSAHLRYWSAAVGHASLAVNTTLFDLALAAFTGFNMSDYLLFTAM